MIIGHLKVDLPDEALNRKSSLQANWASEMETRHMMKYMLIAVVALLAAV